jgi:hypothetical protein
LYSQATIDDYFNVFEGKAGWQQIIESSQANYALSKTTNDAKIENLPGRRLVYSDSVATVAARDTATWPCPTAAQPAS